MVLFRKVLFKFILSTNISLFERIIVDYKLKWWIYIPFHSTSKADFYVVKIPCVLKFVFKTRPHKNSSATGLGDFP